MDAFYHHSDVEFTSGDILEPQKEGYVHWPENTAMESVLEFFRPEHCLPRDCAVFLFQRERDHEDYGASGTSLLYEVKPLGDVQRSDMNWLNELDQGFDDPEQVADFLRSFSPKELKALAEGYWSGQAREDVNKTPKFEYRTPMAEIIQLIAS